MQDGLLDKIVPNGDSDEEWNRSFKNGFNRVRKWTSQDNIFKKQCLFIPVNLFDHWSLIIVYTPGYLVLSRLVLCYHVSSCSVLSCLIDYPVMCYHVLYCLVLCCFSCLVLRCLVLTCLVLSCRYLVLSCLDT